MDKIEFIKEIIEYSKDMPRLEAEIKYWEEYHNFHHGKGFYRLTKVAHNEFCRLVEIRDCIELINKNLGGTK